MVVILSAGKCIPVVTMRVQRSSDAQTILDILRADPKLPQNGLLTRKAPPAMFLQVIYSAGSGKSFFPDRNEPA